MKVNLCDFVCKIGPRAWLVPGHEGRRYLVSRRKDETAFRCDLDTGIGYIPCPGAARSVCYHIRAAAEAAARDKGYKTAWARTEKAAHKVARLHPGAQVWRVTSARSGAFIWAIVWPMRRCESCGGPVTHPAEHTCARCARDAGRDQASLAHGL